MSHLLQHGGFLLYQQQSCTLVRQLFLKADKVYILPDCQPEGTQKVTDQNEAVFNSIYELIHMSVLFIGTCVHPLVVF